MKTRFLILLLALCQMAGATNRFVKTNGGTGAGTSDGTAWSVAQYDISRNLLVAGDTVFFKAGGTYITDFPITDNSGTVNSPIVYSSYGTGAKPIITSLAPMTTWTPSGTANVYYTTLDVTRLNVVVVNGTIRAMGRYPKSGYITITASSGFNSVSGDMSGVAFDPTGGEAVVKKERYIIDRHPITSKSGNTLNITAPGDWGPTNNYNITVGNGFFIQGSLGTLTQFGEWWYDNPNNRLYMNFAGTTPGATSVQAATTMTLALVNSRSYIKFDNLDLRGCNENLIDAQYADHISTNNVDFSFADAGFSGLQGIAGHTTTKCTFTNLLSAGISTYETNDHFIEDVVVRRIHMLEGMGRSGDLIGSGITVTGNNIRINRAEVDSVGYCGISFYASQGADIGKAGNNVIVENSRVRHFCINKDDGGGIYCYGNAPQTFVVRHIRNNIVTDGVGNVQGAGAFAALPYAVGIYLDNHSSNTKVSNNLVANVTGAGVFFNSVNRDTLINNTIFNCGFTGFLQLHLPGQTIYDLYIANNKFIARGTERLLDFEQYMPISNINSFGTITNNIFYRPFGTNSFITLDDRNSGSPVITDMTMSQFQSSFSHAVGSISPVTISNVNNFFIEYNYSAINPLGISIPGVYKNVANTTFTGTIPLNAYTGDVLIYQSALPPPVPTTPFQREVFIIKGLKVKVIEPTPPQIP